ncbi:MAG: VanW family protein [Clostridia bacterium]|nr:VanW family protein [Clostridia bacterium]
MGKKNKGNDSPEQITEEVVNEVNKVAVSEENKETTEVATEQVSTEIVEEIQTVETPKKEKKAKKEKAPKIVDESKSKFAGLSKGLAIAGIIAAVIVICLVAFALANKLNDKVYSNIYLNGVDMSGKTREEVEKYIDDYWTKVTSKQISIKNGEKELILVTADSIDLVIDKNAMVVEVMAYGRDKNKNIVMNNLDIVKAYFEKQNIDLKYSYTENKLANVATEAILEVDERVKDDTYTVDKENNTLIITKGAKGKDFVATEFKSELIDVILDEVATVYEVKLEDAEREDIDVDVLFAEVHKDAKDAYADESVKPAVYYKHEFGTTFDKEDLRKVLAKEENMAEGKVIEYKLTTTQPKVTIQALTKTLYKDKLGSCTSDFSNSDANRASNVKLAAKMLNGTIVMPGETFSFNKTMGDCGLASRGFKSAAVFKNGKVVKEIGGGVCQLSSSLYVATLYANLGIVARSQHALPVGYVPVSLDATVYYPYTDFKFKNTRNYPIKISATTTTNRRLVVTIYGTKEDIEYDVKLTSWVTEWVSPKVQKQNDSSILEGKTKTIQKGAKGYKSVAYKTVSLKGKVISKTLLSSDSYGATPTIIAVGTKKPVNIYGE